MPIKLIVEPLFGKGDYIINPTAGDMAIVDSITKKNYYHFKVYYSAMFDEFRDAKNKLNDLQVNYQKFWSLCNDDEKQRLDELIKEKGGN